ncbi:MAG: amidohydrolase [Solirubrobacterales bacterium]|nr:amidohydrolase [Solirubrobacterales bacterium]
MIDVHAHYFPPAYTEAFARLSGGRKAWPEHPADLTDRVAGLEEAGVERQVIGLGHNQPYFADADASAECARIANDVYAEAIAPHDRLSAFGAVPLPHAALAVAEAARCLDDLGFAGIGLGTTAVERTLDDPEFEPLWAELDRRGTTVFLHPVGTPDVATTGMDAWMMGPKFGGPHEATIATARIVLSGLTQRHPSIKFVVAPLGGTLPYLWRRFEEMSEVHIKAGRLSFEVEGDPLDELRRIYYDTSLSDAAAPFQLVADLVGIDQIVLGTDDPRVRPVDWIAAIKAIPGVDERVLAETARTKLGL